MHSRPTPAPSTASPPTVSRSFTAVSLTAIAFAIGTAQFIWSRSGLKGNAILLAGVVALVVAFPVNWFFPRWRAPLAATGAVFLCGYVASPVARRAAA